MDQLKGRYQKLSDKLTIGCIVPTQTCICNKHIENPITKEKVKIALKTLNKKEHIISETGECVEWCPACGPECRHGYNSYECKLCKAKKVYIVHENIAGKSKIISVSSTKEKAEESMKKHDKKCNYHPLIVKHCLSIQEWDIE